MKGLAGKRRRRPRGDERGSCGMIDRVQRTRFPIGQEPKVLTSVSEECSRGECDKCPGIFNRDDYPGQSIFCVHDCHQKRNQDRP